MDCITIDFLILSALAVAGHVIRDTDTPDGTSPNACRNIAIEKRPSLSQMKKHRKLGNNKKFSHIYHISADTVAKTGPSVTPAEVSAMRLAKEKGVPVPSIFDVYQDPETTWWVVLMSKVDGDSLDVQWDVLTEQDKESVIQSLKPITERLRSGKTSRCIGSVDMTGITDALFLSRYSGPFVNEAEFTAGLIQSLSARQEGAWMQLLSQLLMSMPCHGDESIFTHGRLNPQNILVRDGEVVAILDWGEAGYYPRYWETVKACFWHADVEFFLGALGGGVLDAWPNELSLMLHVRDIVF